MPPVPYDLHNIFSEEQMPRGNEITRIVRLRRMIKCWRAKTKHRSGRPPSDVPPGHVAVLVGVNCRRFIVRVACLNHPVFEALLVQAEEANGFGNVGPLIIPCDESAFEELLGSVTRSPPTRPKQFPDERLRCCRVGASHDVNFVAESRPLLFG